MFANRNEALGIAQRTRKNLMLTKEVFKDEGENCEFHRMTHVMNSLLGIVIHPFERHETHELWEVSLKQLEEEGWPKWNRLLDKQGKSNPNTWTSTETLGRLVEHLRNASAHGRFIFDGEPDSKVLSKVKLIVSDAPSENAPVNWTYEIYGDKLEQFCLLLAKRIESYLG